ncbi:MAG TPA: hypothetical protein DCL54_03870 [Alphaproteobacteria bacterium]|nr:hypothetical protein [Alphaproteobacteria bacterium]HAJ45702.1 hypothetical protein [Alphaproteobacteria bacterium]
MKIVAPIVGVVFLFGAGFYTGYGQGKNAGVAIAYRAAETAAQEIVVREVQVEKCQGEVAKVNEATAAQAVETVKLVKADQELRKQAEQRAVRREAETQRRLDAAFSTLDELRKQIDAGAFKGCANEHVGADLVGMLNAALAAEAGDSP